MPARDTRGDGEGPDDIPHTANGWALVPVSGDLDFYSAPDLEKLLASVTSAGDGKRVVVDMREVTFMDSSGLRVLLDVARELRGSGGALRLAGAREQVLRVLELTQVEPLLPAYADVASACHD